LGDLGINILDKNLESEKEYEAWDDVKGGLLDIQKVRSARELEMEFVKARGVYKFHFQFSCTSHFLYIQKPPFHIIPCFIFFFTFKILIQNVDSQIPQIIPTKIAPEYSDPILLHPPNGLLFLLKHNFVFDSSICLL
jgi:hypothetical protein